MFSYKIEFKTEIISYIVPRGFFALSLLATFSPTGGRLESVKSKKSSRLVDVHLGGLALSEASDKITPLN